MTQFIKEYTRSGRKQEMFKIIIILAVIVAVIAFIKSVQNDITKEEEEKRKKAELEELRKKEEQKQVNKIQQSDFFKKLNIKIEQLISKYVSNEIKKGRAVDFKDLSKIVVDLKIGQEYICVSIIGPISVCANFIESIYYKDLGYAKLEYDTVKYLELAMLHVGYERYYDTWDGITEESLRANLNNWKTLVNNLLENTKTELKHI